MSLELRTELGITLEFQYNSEIRCPEKVCLRTSSLDKFHRISMTLSTKVEMETILGIILQVGTSVEFSVMIISVLKQNIYWI